MLVCWNNGDRDTQSVSLSAAMSSNSGVFSALMILLSSSIVSFKGILIENGVVSPSTRQNRPIRLSAIVLRSTKCKRNVVRDERKKKKEESRR